jgi:hypothetical protein
MQTSALTGASAAAASDAPRRGAVVWSKRCEITNTTQMFPSIFLMTAKLPGRQQLPKHVAAKPILHE